LKNEKFKNGQEFWEFAKRVLKKRFFVHFYFFAFLFFAIFNKIILTKNIFELFTFVTNT
jgi:hypothetical protein